MKRTRNSASGLPAVSRFPAAGSPIRGDADRAANAAAAFCADHPEYAKLGLDGVEQAMATHRTSEVSEARRALYATPVMRRMTWSDDL